MSPEMSDYSQDIVAIALSSLNLALNGQGWKA